MPIGILGKAGAKVNAKITICVNKIALENLSVSDVLENIKILLNYIKKRRRNQFCFLSKNLR